MGVRIRHDRSRATLLDARVAAQAFFRIAHPVRWFAIRIDSARGGRQLLHAVRCIEHAGSLLHLELAPHGVSVNQAIPGAVNTKLLQQSMASDLEVFPDAAAYKRIGDQGRWVRTAAVARFFAWLLTQASSDQFDQPDLNIADPAHQDRWSDGLPIYHDRAS